MEYDIIWSRRARDELKAVHEYIALDNPTAADRVCDAITDRVAVLRGAPRLAQRYTSDANAEVRQTISGKYRIFFSINETECRIEVLSVWHSARQEPEL